MKQNKLKEKWNSLSWYQRDVIWRCAASIGALLLLMGLSECVQNKRTKDKQKEQTTQVKQDIPEDYLRFRENYIKQQQQQQKQK